jgi:hypothetical protein
MSNAEPLHRVEDICVPKDKDLDDEAVAVARDNCARYGFRLEHDVRDTTTPRVNLLDINQSHSIGKTILTDAQIDARQVMVAIVDLGDHSSGIRAISLGFDHFSNPICIAAQSYAFQPSASVLSLFLKT